LRPSDAGRPLGPADGGAVRRSEGPRRGTGAFRGAHGESNLAVQTAEATRAAERAGALAPRWPLTRTSTTRPSSPAPSATSDAHPFVVGYIAVMKVDPLGVLFMFGVSALAVGLFYKTPIRCSR